jgi:Glycosyl transferases group 1
LQAAETFKPDLVALQLHYADPFKPYHAARLRDIVPRAKIVNWNGDVYDRSGDMAYTEMLRQHFDLHTVVNVTARDNYRAKGVRCEYWQIPYEPNGVGYDPLLHSPRFDILFLGNGYSTERIKFAEWLRDFENNTGATVGIYGHYPKGLANGENLYDFQEGCRLYRNAKIALADSQWPDAAEGFTSNRLFQVLAAGGAMLMQQRFRGMTEHLGLIEGKHLVEWNSLPDLWRLLLEWLHTKQEPLRKQIARAGQAECLVNHSADARVKQLLGWLTPPGETDPTLANFHGKRGDA